MKSLSQQTGVLSRVPHVMQGKAKAQSQSAGESHSTPAVVIFAVRVGSAAGTRAGTPPIAATRPQR